MLPAMQTTSAWQRAVAILCCFTLTACMTMREVPIAAVQPQSKTLELKTGRTIIATLKDGSIQRFKLKAVEADVLTGQNGERVAFADITSLKVERISPALTTFAVIGAVAVVSAIAVNAFEHDLADALNNRN
jgi:hypothetical protein